MPTRLFTGSALVISLILALACSPQTSPQAILAEQIQAAFGQIPDPINVRVVNQTSSNVELDILVDGAPVRISCSIIQGVCDQPLLPCPQTVEAVQERLLNDQGQFTGGRNFNGSPDFTFTGGEISCGSVIIYQFTDTTASAFVL